MKAKVNSNRCGSFRRYKGIIQPRCGCNACWDFYFYKNPGKVAAAALALKELDENSIVKAQGKVFYDAIRPELVQAMIADKRVTIDKDTIIENRGQKFLRHLKRWLTNNPIPENVVPEPEPEPAVA